MAVKPVYGGQAVVEGVMMRGSKHYAVAVHQADGSIDVQTTRFRSIKERFKIFTVPFIRGIIAFVEAMIIGYSSLMKAANMAAGDEEGDLQLWMLILTIIISVGFGLALFKFLPLGIATGLNYLIPVPSWLFNVIDGIVTLLIFVFYLYLIGRAQDIKDLFRYHGAEHKVINCFEQGKKLTLKNIFFQSQVHLRCGTTFIFVVFLISILVYVAIPKTLPFFMNLGLRILLLPFIAAIAFELQHFSARKKTYLLRALIAPGLWLQSLTVNAPQVKHVRTAKRALEAVIACEQNDQK